MFAALEKALTRREKTVFTALHLCLVFVYLYLSFLLFICCIPGTFLTIFEPSHQLQLQIAKVPKDTPPLHPFCIFRINSHQISFSSLMFCPNILFQQTIHDIKEDVVSMHLITWPPYLNPAHEMWRAARADMKWWKEMPNRTFQQHNQQWRPPHGFAWLKQTGKGHL